MAKEFPAKVKIEALDRITRTLDKIRGKFPELDKGVRRTNTAFQVINKSTEKFKNSLDKIGGKVQSVGQALTVGLTLPAIAAAGFSVKAFADYETALVGVGKTTNLQGKELQDMGQRFRDMSKTIPVSVEELLTLGQTAAQLGVSGSENITKFSEVLAKLSRASDVAGDEGAANLARLITVTRGSVGDVDRFASALVQLGNTSAATENEILTFATRLGGATAVFNVSAVDSLGMATAMKSLGIEAEAGSSSVQRAFGAINKAILGGGKKLAVLQQITGMTGEELQKRFKTDAVGVFSEFTKGLSEAEKKGYDVSQMLAGFGLTGVRDIQVIGTLTKNVDLLDQKLETARQGFKDNVALENEFAAASKTLNNQFQLFKNTLNDAAISLGSFLAPAVSKVLEVLRGLFGFLSRNPAILALVAAFAAALAIIGPVILALGTLITLLPSLITGWAAFTAVMAGFKIASYAAFLPWLIIGAKFIAIGALIVGLIAIIWKFRDAIMEGFGVAFNYAYEKLGLLLDKLSGMGSAIKGFFGFNAGAEMKTQEIAAKGSAVAPNGQPVGGLETSEKINREFLSQTNSARVDINVRAPESTMIKSESQNGILSISRGLAGAF